MLSSFECNEGKRDVTITFGEIQKTPYGCLIEGETKAAQLAFSPKLGDNYYVKVKCVPKDTKELGR